MLLALLDNPAFRLDLNNVLKHGVSEDELRDLKKNLSSRIEFIPKKFRDLIRKSDRLKRFLILIEKAYQRGDQEVYIQIKYFFLALLKDKAQRRKFR